MAASALGLILAGVITAGAGPRRQALVLLETRGRAEQSSVLLIDAHSGATLATLGRVPHLPDAALRGALLAGSADLAAPAEVVVLVTADRAQGRDRSWGSSLWRVEPGRPALELCDGVAHASRPLVSPTGRVFVERGRAGTPRPGALRIDRVEIAEIDPAGAAGGAARTVFTAAGHGAHLAGWWGHELLLYLVHPRGAALLAVDPDTRSSRVLLPSMLPLARDFSVSSDGALIFAERDETRADRWVIDRLQLDSGARRRLHASPSQELAPLAWPGGSVAYSTAHGLMVLGQGLRGAPDRAIDVARALSPDGALAAVWRYRPGEALPRVVILEVADPSGERELRGPAGIRREIVGFTGPLP